MADKNTIKNWFKTGLIPTQAQFWATWDSFWHKDDLIPLDKIEGLQEVLDDKADQEALESHLSDEAAHAELFKKAKIYAAGELQIFKEPNNTDDYNLEAGDYCIGFVEGQFINADYLGGDRLLLSSFDI